MPTLPPLLPATSADLQTRLQRIRTLKQVALDEQDYAAIGQLRSQEVDTAARLQALSSLPTPLPLPSNPSSPPAAPASPAQETDAALALTAFWVRDALVKLKSDRTL